MEDWELDKRIRKTSCTKMRINVEFVHNLDKPEKKE